MSHTLEETLQKLEELLIAQSRNNSDPEAVKIIEKLCAEARIIRRKLNKSSRFMDMTVDMKGPFEARIDALAAKYSETHDDKIKG